MSLIPGEKLHYAETHFKFKLPWSLLYKPWPEILVDAPFQFWICTEAASTATQRKSGTVSVVVLRK